MALVDRGIFDPPVDLPHFLPAAWPQSRLRQRRAVRQSPSLSWRPAWMPSAPARRPMAMDARRGLLVPFCCPPGLTTGLGSHGRRPRSPNLTRAGLAMRAKISRIGPSSGGRRFRWFSPSKPACHGFQTQRSLDSVRANSPAHSPMSRLVLRPIAS